MSKAKAITLGFFTIWPILYMVLFMCSMFIMVFLDIFTCGHSQGVPNSQGVPLVFMIIFPLHFLTMLEMLALIVIYIVHIFQTEYVPPDKKDEVLLSLS